MCLECIGWLCSEQSTLWELIGGQWSHHLSDPTTPVPCILDHKPPVRRKDPSEQGRLWDPAWFTLFVLLPSPSNVTICLRSVMFKVSRVVQQILADIRALWRAVSEEIQALPFLTSLNMISRPSRGSFYVLAHCCTIFLCYLGKYKLKYKSE